MLVKVNETVPVLLMVISCEALTVFLVTPPNARELADSVKVGAVTVPLSVTVCVGRLAKRTLMVAAFALGLVGVIVTLMVQFAPTATTAGNTPQVLVWAN